MPNTLPINPTLANLPVYLPGKPIEEVARELGMPAENILKLASNENPLGPSPKALGAMRDVLGQLHLYPDGSAFHLKRKLADHLGVKPEHLILGNGSNEILEFVGHALISPGTEVVVSEYCFAVYSIVTHLFGGTLVTVPHKDYGHDLAAMSAAITPRTRVVFVANPNNPTGTRAPNQQLLEFVRAVPKNVLIALDEAYVEFLENPPQLIDLVLSNHHSNLVLMRTFSKIYGLAGLRLGYGIASPDLIQALERVRQPFNTNALIQSGALAALEDAEHLRKTLENNREGLQYFETCFQQMGLPFVPSYANFVLVRVGNGASVFEALQKQGVIARPMGGYGLPEWIRLTVGTGKQNERCILSLRKALEP